MSADRSKYGRWGFRAAGLAIVAFTAAGCSGSSMTFLDLRNPFSHDEKTAFYGSGGAMARAVTADDLVGADGSCAGMAPAAPSPVTQTPFAHPAAEIGALAFQAGPSASGAAPAGPAPSAAPSARGIALEMTECDVVRIAGPTGNVQIGANERGERSVVMTYLQGERAGIYRFTAGRLASIERSPEPPKPVRPAKPAKKKAASKT